MDLRDLMILMVPGAMVIVAYIVLSILTSEKESQRTKRIVALVISIMIAFIPLLFSAIWIGIIFLLIDIYRAGNHNWFVILGAILCFLLFIICILLGVYTIKQSWTRIIRNKEEIYVSQEIRDMIFSGKPMWMLSDKVKSEIYSWRIDASSLVGKIKAVLFTIACVGLLAGFVYVVCKIAGTNF